MDSQPIVTGAGGIAKLATQLGIASNSFVVPLHPSAVAQGPAVIPQPSVPGVPK
jgi:hypothetical protein